MPELPEVETMCRGLAPYMVKRQIVAAELRRPNLRFPFPPDFATRLKGARVKQLRRRGKFILIHLKSQPMADEVVWLSHLGMTGRYHISLKGARAKEGKHDHVRLSLDDGTSVIYSDARRFGYMDLCPAPSLAQNRFLVRLGVEPLGDELTPVYAAQLLAASRQPIKNALLNQHIIAGLGNIYVCEALFRAGISPRRRADRLSAPRVARLVEAIQSVLAEAIEAGGSTLRDFANAHGEQGYFQHHFQVYGRAGDICANQHCGAMIKRIVQTGRASFYCPKCQR